MKNDFWELNKKQKEATNHFQGPCMVLAGPGTGKTTIIINRILNLLIKHGVSPKTILVVTFTKAASQEMKDRFSNNSKYKQKYRAVEFGTFHSIFFKILREYKDYKLEDLVKENEKHDIVKMILRTQDYNHFWDEESLDEIIAEISLFKSNLGKDGDYLPKSCDRDVFFSIKNEYEGYLSDNKKYDYDDMIIHCYNLLTSNSRVLNKLRNQYKFILIDEFQDINTAQFETIKLISYPLNNIFVVGDDDQSIYGFRGADPSIMKNFEFLYKNNCQSKLYSDKKDLVKIITLGINYRNTSLILNSAVSIINNNKNRYKKELKSHKDFGLLPKLLLSKSFEEEAEIIGNKIQTYINDENDNSSIAIIYRTNIQSRLIVEELIRKNISFVCRDGYLPIYNHWIFEDIICYLKASQNIERNNSIYRIINKPYRHIGRELIRDFFTNKACIIDELIYNNTLSVKQLKELQKLRSALERLGSKNAIDAVKYIIDNIGYGRFVSEYAKYRQMDYKLFKNIFYEIQSSARGFIDIRSFLESIENTEYRLMNFKKGLKGDRKIEIMTMHKAKGLEFDKVFVTGVIETLIPYYQEKNISMDRLEEERRLFYVAMTRARKSLYLSIPKHRYAQKTKVSRFIGEMTTWLTNAKNNL